MSRRIYILVFGSLVLFAGVATFYWSRFEEVATPQHGIFKLLDDACRRKYGEPYGFRTNQCCDKTAADVCEPL